MPIIAPSLLSADFLNLQKDCRMLNESKADWFHLDIMDGRFVPNISFGPMIVEVIRSSTKKFCDVHLMIEEPENFTEAFKKAGADNLTIHYEACRHLHRNVQQIKSLGMQAGVAINPHTSVEALNDILPFIDMVCMMSVNPGFGGQSFIQHTINKIIQLKKMINARSLNVKIEVDGGITEENAKAVVDAGGDILVAGNSVFKSNDPVATIAVLKNG